MPIGSPAMHSLRLGVSLVWVFSADAVSDAKCVAEFLSIPRRA